jgi:uncharacterized protein (TIGR00269 family)
VKCKRCDKPAVVRLKYAKLNLCGEHFLEYIEMRVEKAIRRYRMLDGVKRILVGLSGGKDSLSLLYILSRLRDKLGVELIGLHIDLGLSVYSEASRRAVVKACEETKTPCIIVSLKELVGYTMPELVAKTKRPACSLCGLLKRYLLNAAAIELGVDAVALGHHMDDILEFALKDFLSMDLTSLSKMTPITPGYPGVAARRLKILYEVQESELELYAKLRGVDYVTSQCPFKYYDPFRLAARRLFNELEERAPGFKISFIRRLAKTARSLVEEKIEPCRYCNMPSSTGVCGVCKLTAKIYGEPQGAIIRARLKGLLKNQISSNRDHPE